MGCNSSSHQDIDLKPIPDLPETIASEGTVPNVCGSSATNGASTLDDIVKVTGDDMQVRGSVRALCPAGTISRARESAPYTTQQNDTIMEMLASSNKANYTNRMNPKKNRSFEIFRILKGKGDKPDEVIFRNHRPADSTPAVGSEVEVYFTKEDEWIAAKIERPHPETGKVCVRYHDMPDQPFGVDAQRIRCVPSNYYVSFWIDHGDNDNLKWCAYGPYRTTLQPGRGASHLEKEQGTKITQFFEDKILSVDTTQLQKFTFSGANEKVKPVTSNIFDNMIARENRAINESYQRRKKRKTRNKHEHHKVPSSKFHLHKERPTITEEIPMDDHPWKPLFNQQKGHDEAWKPFFQLQKDVCDAVHVSEELQEEFGNEV